MPTITANRRPIRDDVERTSKLTRFISRILRAAVVFRIRNLASAAPPVEGTGEITTCPLFEGGKAAALLSRSYLQQANILQRRRNPIDLGPSSTD
jgi:hypothetical protein